MLLDALAQFAVESSGQLFYTLVRNRKYVVLLNTTMYRMLHFRCIVRERNGEKEGERFEMTVLYDKRT